MFFLFFFSGTEFNYTTHGYTLLSAVIESVSGEPFLKYIQKLFRELGLHNTYLDENGPIIPHRSRYVVCTLDMLFCREVTVHQKCELSSVLVNLAKKGTKFSSKFTLLKKNLVQFTNLKMNFSVHFSVHLKNISKGSMPKSGPIDNLEVFLWDNNLNIINFLGKSLEFFYLQQNSNVISIF